MHVPFWLVLLAAGWLLMAVLATALIAWAARFGPTEEEALEMTRPRPAPEPAAPQPTTVPAPLASDVG